MSGTSESKDGNRNGWIIYAWVVGMLLLLVGCAGEAPKTYRVGILVGADTLRVGADSFKNKMAELGYIEGKNITYDVQKSNGDPAEEKRIAGEFAAKKVDLVFAFPGQSARSVKAALQGTDIPIVFANAVLEGANLVDSVRSPGGNITGVRVPGIESVLKSFESLLEFTPRFERIMVIYDPNYATTSPALEALREVASSSNVTLQEVQVTQVQDTQAVLERLEQSGEAGMDAIQLLQDTLARSAEASGTILRFADAHRVPVVGGPKTLVQGGALLSASSDIVESAEMAAPLADQILKGTPAGTIPVVSPQPHLYVNYKKAQELGLTVPPGLLKQAVEIFR